MITLCWAAKGGSGTTVVTAAMALASTEPTLLIDLDGDLPAVLGIPGPDGPGVHDWLRSEAEPDRLNSLEIPVDQRVTLLSAGRLGPVGPDRWSILADWLQHERRRVIIDAGSRQPTRELHEAADQAWLVTRPCYLALTAAAAHTRRPTGVVLIDEPGRALRPADIEASLGAPIVATTLCDPAIARSVDAGLLVSRLPGGFRRRLREAAG